MPHYRSPLPPSLALTDIPPRSHCNTSASHAHGPTSQRPPRPVHTSPLRHLTFACRVHVKLYRELLRARLQPDFVPPTIVDGLFRDIVRLKAMSAVTYWRSYANCISLHKPTPGDQPNHAIERRWRLYCEPGAPCRTHESPNNTLPAAEATNYLRGKLQQTGALIANPVSPAATPTSENSRPRPSIQYRGESGLSRARVFTRLPRQCLEAYRNVQITLLRICTGLARTRGPNAHATTEAMQDREMLIFSIARRFYQRKEGRGNDALEIAVLRTRITRAHAGYCDAIVQLWHEAFDTAKEKNEWLKKHPEALYKQICEKLRQKSAFRERATCPKYHITGAHFASSSTPSPPTSATSPS